MHKTYVDDSDDESEEDGPVSDDEGNPTVAVRAREGRAGDETRRLAPARDASDDSPSKWRRLSD